MVLPHGKRSLPVLIVDDERELRESLSRQIQDLGHLTLQASDGEEALALIKMRGIEQRNSIKMVLLDVHMPKRSGLDILSEIKQIDPSIFVVIITAHGNIRDAVEAMRQGAYNYIEKPIQESDLKEIVEKASEAQALIQKFGLSSPQIQFEHGERFIGSSKKMRSIFETIARLGQVNTSVLIRGENGTGKELVARAIHFNSNRKDKPFVAVNCGAIPENLAESEFFGHEKGTFTGAESRKIGKFQFAEGGTLFLDEIAEISPAMQVKFLRVLQERCFSPIGSNREIKTDVRIIAATNQNLEGKIASGAFRQDLFYRLNVVPITLPSLRERTDDIPNLVNHFIEKFNLMHDRISTPLEIQGIQEEALEALMSYHWPGNIRELENTIERAFVLENGLFIGLDSLPQNITSSFRVISTIKDSNDFQNQKERFEREFIINALKQFQGRINQTVAHAGIPKNTLLRKIRKYGINPSDFGHPVDHQESERGDLNEEITP